MKIRNSKFEIRNKSKILILKLVIGVLVIISLFWLGCLSLVAPVYAQEKPGTEEELTKGEAVVLISASDFMKKKIGELLSWTIGYDISKVSRLKLTPSINYVMAVPKKVPPDGRTILEIQASVDDPGGLKNIAGVRADLSSIGRLPNTMLVDNGLFGDQKASDGIYTLQTSVSPKIEMGAKEVPVAVANKKGWLALAKTTLDVRLNPAIIEAKFVPERAGAGSPAPVLLTVEVENPGRIEDISKVTADLRSFGYTELVLLHNDGKEGDAVAGDEIFSLQFMVPDYVVEGDYSVRVGASNLAGGYGFADVTLKVYK